MFRKGGSAEGGITSGLQSPRQGYKLGERVTEVVDEMRTVLPQRNSPKRRFNDFLIDFGLDIATRSPMGSGIASIASGMPGQYQSMVTPNPTPLQNALGIASVGGGLLGNYGDYLRGARGA